MIGFPFFDYVNICVLGQKIVNRVKNSILFDEVINRTILKVITMNAFFYH